MYKRQALTGGLAYEGLNNAGRFRGKLIVVLNDNTMSISRNVGSIARYLATIRTNPAYRKVKGDVESVLRKIPAVGEHLYRGASTVSYTHLDVYKRQGTYWPDR